MTTTMLLLTVAATVLLAATVWTYERITDDLRDRLAAAQQFADDSQVLLNAVLEEAQADSMRRHPAGSALPRPVLSLVQVSR